MKKWKWLFALLSGILLLTSCSRGSRMTIFDDSDRKADERFVKIQEAISSKDVDAIKMMFSKQALSESSNFDENLQLLFGYIHGSIDSWKKPTGSCTINEEINADGKGHHKKEVQSTYVLITSEQEYHIAIYEYTIDTENPENVGVYSISVISAEDKQDSKFVYWGSGKAGINIGQ